MEQKSMTARISAFARAYHAQNNKVKVFDDSIARRLLSDAEYAQISKLMADGIRFFNPAFQGTAEEALRWVVDNQLSPSPVGRAAFVERLLENAVRIGARQYFIFGAGYDTFAYRQPDFAKSMEIFEIDNPATARDKQERLKKAGIEIPSNVHFIDADFTKSAWQEAIIHHEAFNPNKISYSTILGVAYYLSKQDFEALLSVLRSISPKGSAVVLIILTKALIRIKRLGGRKYNLRWQTKPAKKCWQAIRMRRWKAYSLHMTFSYMRI